jgi:hypothetical protein
MALGHKTGGRKAGTPNRKTREIGELLEPRGHNPIFAEVLSIVTGGELTPEELLSNAHALLALAPDDPRRERIYLAVLRTHEAAENGNLRAVLRHELEFTMELLRLMQ